MKHRMETERLLIRNFEVKDAEGLLMYLSHPRANCFAEERIGTIQEAIADIKRRSKDGLQYAVCLKDKDVIIGNLFAVKEEPDTYSAGWNFNEKYEGKGYASEAAREFFSFLFANKNARRVYGYVEDDNIRSKNLCERLGMKKEAHFIEFISFVKNNDGTPKYENTFVFSILKKYWIC